MAKLQRISNLPEEDSIKWIIKNLENNRLNRKVISNVGNMNIKL